MMKALIKDWISSSSTRRERHTALVGVIARYTHPHTSSLQSNIYIYMYMLDVDIRDIPARYDVVVIMVVYMYR